MEGLRAVVQQRWKQSLSPQGAILLFVFVIIIALGGLCATAVSRRKKTKAAHAKQVAVEEVNVVGAKNKSSCGGVVKRVLMGSVRWNKWSRWEQKECVNLDRMPALLAGVSEMEWSGRSIPISPLWQRRILMGERCELPRFSGLILYDERGHPLRQQQSDKALRHPSETAAQQEKPAAVVTTLRDLL